MPPEAIHGLRAARRAQCRARILNTAIVEQEAVMQWRNVANDRMAPPAKGEATPIVYVVDDDISVREALETLIEFSGWRAIVFASAREFLCHSRPDTPSCLILDVSLPDLSGLELQQQLKTVRS